MYSLRVFLLATIALSLTAAAYDWRTHRIPNWLTLGGLLGGLVGHAAFAYVARGPELALRAASLSLLGAVVVAAVPLLLWFVRAMGGGDVKVIAAVGAVCHASLGMTVVFVAFLAMLSFIVLRLAWYGQFWRSALSVVNTLLNPLRSPQRRVQVAVPLRDSVPFGPALAFSSVVLLVVQGGT